MSTLYLIRHGQASFGTDDYDRLSELGRVQAQRTGEYLYRSGVTLDAVYTGSLKRQKDTASLALAAQPRQVEAIVDPRFDEIRNDEQFEHLAPFLAGNDPQLAELLSRSHNESKPYQKVLAAVFDYWVRNDCSEFGIQSWDDYRGSVRTAMAELMDNEGSGKQVALFTSGGTIATIVSQVLGMEGIATYKFYEPMFNCAISQLVFSGGRVSLASYNDCSFLRVAGSDAGEQLVTYR
ncbi:histidine phosphatase family protein [Haliea sp. E17]|uniref:histidine phosphatase family protein n=1 Tax=Haliea sp. E17 TaxID=3401576 RepID=UPI003AAD7B7D